MPNFNMTINNKLLLSIIVFSLGLIIIGFIGLSTDNENLDIVLKPSIFLFIITGGYFIIKNGTFIYSPEYRFVKLGIAIILVGTMFKIMHWPFATPILGLGCISFSIVYLYYLIQKNQTRWSDFIKLIFVLTVSIGRLFKMFHWPYSKEITIVGMIALIILIIDLIKTKKVHLDKK